MIDKDTKAVYTYKDPKTLAKFVDERGKIQSGLKSGLTAKEQRLVTREIKRARQLGLLPYTQTTR
jgi:small subunit ribosomal protein S18